jgi:hypothetical protein
MKYQYNKTALYHPESCPVFSKNLPTAAFVYSEESFSLVNAWWLSKLSHLAYFNRKEIEIHLDQVGLQLFAFFSKNGSSAFIAISENFAVLSFRGTAIGEKDNIMNDIDIRLTPITEAISVHAGFLQSLDQIWPEIEIALNQLKREKIKVWYTGHSLGAAMATLASTRYKTAAVYVYGSPRVGNKAFGDSIKDQNNYNIGNCCDVVTIQPPELLGYQAAGEIILITSNFKLIFSPSTLQVIRERSLGYFRFYKNLYWLHSDSVYLRSLADHIMVNYSSAILKNIKN